MVYRHTHNIDNFPRAVFPFRFRDRLKNVKSLRTQIMRDVFVSRVTLGAVTSGRRGLAASKARWIFHQHVTWSISLTDFIFPHFYREWNYLNIRLSRQHKSVEFSCNLTRLTGGIKWGKMVLKNISSRNCSNVFFWLFVFLGIRHSMQWNEMKATRDRTTPASWLMAFKVFMLYFIFPVSCAVEFMLSGSIGIKAER